MHSQPPPKGSLEELFRHHLLESEAAAVPPRPLVWEHIDNGLLQAQNEKYRRRLLAYRWGMAASLLLATLAGGGWWHSQQLATTTLASANEQREAAQHAVAGAVSTGPRTYAPAPAAGASAATQRGAAAATAPVASGERAGGTTMQSSVGQSAVLAKAEVSTTEAARHSQGGRATGTPAYATTSLPGRLTSGTDRAGEAASPRPFSTFSSPNAHAIATTATSSPTDLLGSPSAAAQPGASAAASQPEAIFAADAATPALADVRLAEDMLATRPTSLALNPVAGPPAELAMQELPAPEPTLLRHWRYRAAYTIGAFQPNIDFNRNTSEYNTALGANTVSLTRAAAAEYRANLRPGLSQRLGLRATRWLGGHWSLSTGIEVAQQEAYSATSAAFTGEQLADLSNYTAITSPSSSTASSVVAPSRSLHESSFRYRSAGVPIELQYDNQAKAGLSFYGRLGVIVSALLNVRSEVAGNSEATRTYSLTSASTPYRRFTALLRGSAGVRYRPAGRTWGLNVGPTAEAGVQSMNTEPDRSFLQQSRPYSVGIEAGIEFGGLKPAQ